MKNLLYILLSMTLISCATQKNCERKFPAQTSKKDSVVVVIKDSIVIKDSVSVKIKDSIVYSAAVKDSGELDSKLNQVHRYKTDKVEIIIKVVDGKVTYKVNIAPIESRYKTEIEQLKTTVQEYKTKDSLSTSSEVKVIHVTPEPIPWYKAWWNQIRNWLAIIGLIFVAYLFIRYVVLRFIP